MVVMHILSLLDIITLQVEMFSYQCSKLSTAESLIGVFNTAKVIQKKRDRDNFVSVVVLDEVGLAEDSPKLPLKVLHPLLEDGTAADAVEVRYTPRPSSTDTMQCDQIVC